MTKEQKKKKNTKKKNNKTFFFSKNAMTSSRFIVEDLLLLFSSSLLYSSLPVETTVEWPEEALGGANVEALVGIPGLANWPSCCSISSLEYTRIFMIQDHC